MALAALKSGPRLKDTNSCVPDDTRSSSRVGPSRANFSLNTDFVIVHFLHNDFGDQTKVIAADAIWSDTPRFDVCSSHDKRPSDLHRLAHKNKNSVRHSDLSRHNRVRSVFRDKIELDVVMRPMNILIRHWRTTSRCSALQREIAEPGRLGHCVNK